jgi:hypothetical protein
MKTASDFWNGKRPLSQAFWLVWIVGGILVGVVAWIPLIIGLNWLPGLLLPITWVVSLILLAYQIFCYVSVWRCANNVKARYWGVIARVLVVLSVIQMVLALIQTNGLLYGPLVGAFSGAR